MQKTILTYGAITGAVIVASMVIGTVQAANSTKEPTSFSEWAGYLVMIVALSVIFIGIKRYRDRELGGVIRFSTAFLVGLGITLVGSIVYVVAWEVSLSATDYAFADDYVAWVIDQKKAEGVKGPELEAAIVEMNAYKERYANPIFRVPITFLEIFPVGLLITLISALVLRNNKVLPATL